ncbi:FAD binding domain-containing protein [Colletotrichum orchidophilum]|uniref:FAD binding domain-containing protein n=1 Tax=Colletotrichum orchidophilum TaxID=1209926 RepID=A0A1G4BK69_9PEZI|nr:FAD binding domain-containing protein [Colletotrichum orchidophilum]OHF01697.1 FAD binding domain-containing protein [Colletotrichum orchidophilum]
MSSEPFRVIIIGGGPSGITAAHALHHAGIDFIVLERRTNIVEDLGASIVLGAQSLRVFHQFGILDRLMDIGGKLHQNKGFTVDGYKFKDAKTMAVLKKNHGAEPVAFHRAHLIEALYNGLPESAKARYLTGKKLAGIVSTETGVTVSCEDGSSYHGSIVIGADGVHSATRRQMRKLAVAEDPAREATWDAVKPFKTLYRCMWASFPRPTECGQSYETHGTDSSAMYITGKDRGWIFLYEKLPEPTTERISFTDAELEEFAGRFADWPVTDTLKVKDVFQERFNAGGAGLEEGLCENWSWNGRVVLVGDAAHKFTPNAGLGFNNGVQDVVALCNRLQKFVVSESESESGSAKTTTTPDFAALEAQFEAFRLERREQLEMDWEQSARLTRMHAWASTWDWIMARYVLSWTFVQKIFITYVVSPNAQKARVLDFISASEPFEGTYKWLHPMASLKNSPSV